jgi:hypothetical protein
LSGGENDRFRDLSDLVPVKRHALRSTIRHKTFTVGALSRRSGRICFGLLVFSKTRSKPPSRRQSVQPAPENWRRTSEAVSK